MHSVPTKGGQVDVLSIIGDGNRYPGVRDLYEPTLVGFAPNAFRLRGFERIDHPQGAYGAVQEWYVTEPMPEELQKQAGKSTWGAVPSFAASGSTKGGK